ncbi:MAG: phosphoglucosamine mutase [Thermoplasmata archaeon]
MARLFGTNGIRWAIGNESADFPVRLGIDAGNFYGKGSEIAIGFDFRTSSPMIFNAAVSGLLSTGCNTIILGAVPTPVVQFAVKQMNLDGGLMVTASHNPPEFNGLKFFAADGTEISRKDEQEVERLHSIEPGRTVGWDSVGKCSFENHIQSIYKEKLRSFIKLKDKNMTVIVDCANSVAIDYTPDIIANMGCRVLTLNAQPDGRFPGRMPEPLMENVGTLMSTVKAHDANMGVAHDGDADRATFVDEKGDYVTGNQSLALFAIGALKRHGGKGRVVVPINTSRMVEDVVKSNGGKIEYTAVGSPLIARRIMEIGAVLGGEGNGGAIFPEHQLCRDGMMAAVRMLEIVSNCGPMSSLVAELPKYGIKSAKLKIRPELKERILEQVRKDAANMVSDMDGIKTANEEGWMLIRASGTEPIIRVTVETRSEEISDRMLGEKVNYLREVITNLS